MNYKLDTDERVCFYEQEFYVLSNFAAFTLHWKDIRFDTSEAAYHWEKFPDAPKVAEAIRTAPSAHEAFKIAERNRQYRREDWDQQKVWIMRDILHAKAEQHEYVRRKLLETHLTFSTDQQRLLIDFVCWFHSWVAVPNGPKITELRFSSPCIARVLIAAGVPLRAVSNRYLARSLVRAVSTSEITGAVTVPGGLSPLFSPYLVIGFNISTAARQTGNSC